MDEPSLLIRIDRIDSVAVAVMDLAAGSLAAVSGERPILVLDDVPRGHKIALRQHGAGTSVIKYGRSIGEASVSIAPGAHVHAHNLSSKIEGEIDYGAPPANFLPEGRLQGAAENLAILARDATFRGYRREDGAFGVRNQLWIIPTVGCVNGVAERLAAWASGELGIETLALAHPYGCSQLGDDLTATRHILASLARHPNAAGVLVLSLGCENNLLADFLADIGPRPGGRLESLRLQDEGDEIDAGRQALGRLAARANGFEREEAPFSELVLGLKCGGSDAFSGISANPLVGLVADGHVAAGGSILLSEVPEMFGAEEQLLGRAASLGVWRESCSLVNHWKSYYLAHGQGSHENPSPGNREGGITTIEEKSSGCVQKAGSSPVRDVLPYGTRRRERGLSLVAGPGNDLISSTALAAAGAQVILFTTGRGTPFGSVVPTVKISSTSELASRKPNWIDWDAGPVLAKEDPSRLAGDLVALIAAVASGATTKAEESGYRGIAIFKDGVTL